MAGTIDPNDPAAGAALLSLIDEQESLEQALDRLTGTCRDAIPGCSDASVTLCREDGPATVSCTSPAALRVDEWEYANDRGPCIDAMRTGEVQVVPTVEEADRVWEGIGPVLTGNGVASAAGIPLRAGGAVVGAVNLYSDRPDAFGEAAFAVAVPLATQVAVTLHNVRVYDASRTLALELDAAMAARAVVEQAKGILVLRLGCAPDEAFAALEKEAADAGVTPRERARQLVAEVVRGNGAGAAGGVPGGGAR